MSPYAQLGGLHNDYCTVSTDKCFTHCSQKVQAFLVI